MKSAARVVFLIAVIGLASLVLFRSHGDPYTFATESRRADFLVADTVYHATFDLTDSTCSILFGPYPLVQCAITITDSDGFYPSREMQSLRIVRNRRLWAGTNAISERVIATVAAVTHAQPDDIQRIMPERFQIDLSGDLSVFVATDDPQSGVRSLAERTLKMWSGLRSWGAQRTMNIVVSPQDAQILYYALAPGTPVVIIGAETIVRR